MTDLVPEQQGTQSLAVRVVDKAAGLLAGRSSTRRRFLYRFAVIGSALAVDPLRFVTRPTPAYASVCGPGSTCDAGWSVFCCTINDGANTCPTGSFVAGWWKVDASAFCLGSPRYYIDCNRTPGASCRCRCNTTGCDHRRVCCNVFRYGQCNTHIGGVTEVVCRLITCTPPWKWDPACGTTPRTDEATRWHSSKCLPGKNPSRIEIKYQDMGLRGSVLGDPAGRERDGVRQGRKRRYDRGMILWHKTTGAHEVRGSIEQRYRSLDADAGPLGYPRTDRREVADGKGTFNRFERGSLYRHPETGVRMVLGPSDQHYWKVGGPRGRLGYPTHDTGKAGGGGRVTRFQKGHIYVSPDTPAIEVQGSILDVYLDRGGPADSGLGFPAKAREKLSDGGRIQQFTGGMIVARTGAKVFAVLDPIATTYRKRGGPLGGWGYPTSHTATPAGVPHGLESTFLSATGERGTAYWSTATDVRWLHGPIRARYRKEGGPGGLLGYPTTGVQTLESGLQRTKFERGSITYDPATGETQVLLGP